MCFSNIHVLYLCKLSKRINISSVICFRVECDTITNPDSSSFSSKDSFTITTQCSHCVGFSTRQSLISSSISETLLSRVSIRSLQNFFELFPTITLKNTIWWWIRSWGNQQIKTKKNNGLLISILKIYLIFEHRIRSIHIFQDALIKLTDFYKLKQFHNNRFEWSSRKRWKYW